MRVGDAGVWSGAPVELPNGRLALARARQPARRLRRARGGAPGRRGGERAGRRRRGRRRAGGDRALRRARRGVRRSTRRSRSRSTSRRRPTIPGGDPSAPGRIELGAGAMIARGPTLNRQVVELLARGGRGGGDRRTRSRSTRATTSTDADEVHLDARRRPDRARLDPAALHAQPERALRPRRRRGGRRADRRVRASASPPRPVVRPLMAGSQRHRQRRPHAVRQARRRPRGLPGDRARRDRDRGRARADRGRAARAAVRDHGPGAAGRRRAGAGAPGGDRRRPADRDARRHDQQGLRLVDPRDRDRRLDDPRRRRRRRRHGRHGVDVERAVPPRRRRASATASATAS